MSHKACAAFKVFISPNFVGFKLAYNETLNWFY